MIEKHHLIETVDAYMAATGITRDQTASYRIFGDSKKLTALRSDAGITINRFNAAFQWLHQNWPDGIEMPARLRDFTSLSANAHASN